MPHSNHFDVIVIGSGPGGEGAAMGLTKAGLNVAIIEKESSVGGGCTHWGTIPSKALRHAVSRIIEFNSNPLFCQNNKSIHSTFSNILGHAKSVIDKQTRLRQGFYDRNQCTLVFGTARFIDTNTVSVMQSDGTEEQYNEYWKPAHQGYYQVDMKQIQEMAVVVSDLW